MTAGLVLAAALAAVLLRQRDRLYETPEDTVSAFYQAAANGDDQLYLRLVGDELRSSLSEVRKQRGRTAFQEDLRRSARGIKGRAMSRLPVAPADQVGIDVELVFADRNQRQRLLLAPRDGGWVIESMGPAETIKPLIPYGTPVMGE